MPTDRKTSTHSINDGDDNNDDDYDNVDTDADDNDEDKHDDDNYYKQLDQPTLSNAVGVSLPA